jgi:hypothetical protein
MVRGGLKLLQLAKVILDASRIDIFHCSSAINTLCTRIESTRMLRFTEK